MKLSVIIIILFVQSTFISAQHDGIYKDSLSISQEVPYGNSITFNGVSIRFAKVIQDSRCPKEVNCVRAGEADLELIVSTDSVEEKRVKVRIDASGYVSVSNNLVLELPEYRIFAFALEPYPIASGPIDRNRYKLELLIQPIKRE